MPHIASKVVDQDAVKVIQDWLASLNDASLLEQPGAKHPRLPKQ